MHKTTFKISKMDCSSEEHIVRMKLADLTNIHSLAFDLAHRQLTVYHTGNYEPILRRLDELKFDTELIESVSVEDDTSPSYAAAKERTLLWQVLGINFFFFVLELTTGFISRSMGLLADSLDMLADSIVYALALMAVGKSIALKKKIALWAGYFQLTLALTGLAETLRRFLGIGQMPAFQTMIGISLLALMGNALSLYLLQKSKSNEAHMKASMIFTSNDVIANLGVIVAGGLVYLTHSKYPDLIVGTLVFILVGRGAFKIMNLAR